MAPKKMSAAVAPSSEVGMHFAIPEGTTPVCDINLDEDPDDDDYVLSQYVRCKHAPHLFMASGFLQYAQTLRQMLRWTSFSSSPGGGYGGGSAAPVAVVVDDQIESGSRSIKANLEDPDTLKRTKSTAV